MRLLRVIEIGRRKLFDVVHDPVFRIRDVELDRKKLSDARYLKATLKRVLRIRSCPILGNLQAEGKRVEVSTRSKNGCALLRLDSSQQRVPVLRVQRFKTVFYRFVCSHL